MTVHSLSNLRKLLFATLRHDFAKKESLEEKYEIFVDGKIAEQHFV